MSHFGLEIRRLKSSIPATGERPVGQLQATLEDLKARGFSPKRVVDVGANCGHWSRTVLSVWENTCVYMFEPIVQFEQQLRNVAQSRSGSRYWLAALGATSGTIEFNDVVWADGRPTTGSTILTTNHGPEYTVKRRTVPLLSLDDLIAKGEIEQEPELVKMDVEGYELEVLKGSHTLLGKTEVFILETSFYPFWGQPVFHKIVEYMAEQNYLVYDFVGFNRRPKDGALGQADVCFVKRHSFLRRETAWDL